MDLTNLPHELIDAAVLITRADANGHITYVNDKFVEVSGWTYEESVGQDHKIVNSGIHPKEFWKNMYKTVLKDKGIWNAVVTNKTKDGRLYHVDTYIKAELDSEGKLLGFSSIRQDVTKLMEAFNEVNQKNVYLEYAAKILRHDMHSGINTYIPRGISSIERRLNPQIIEAYRLESPLKLLKDGLKHTQKVYTGVKEFTNLVREDKTLDKEEKDVHQVLTSYLTMTSYNDQVIVGPLVSVPINESLFCTAVDNLIRNGLKYNDSPTKCVKIYMLDPDTMAIEDNGRGMTQEEFSRMSYPYTRRANQKEKGTGLGLNICNAILREHGFAITCEKLEQGTLLKVRLR
jgi:PAS domain S-box-containing protein